jgi:hypothetical protein
MQLIADENEFTGTTVWDNATGGVKVQVRLVATDGTVTDYMLKAGDTWPTGITTSNYTDMPEKVTGGTYYAKA